MSRSTREVESRAHEAIEEYDMNYADPFSLPPGVAKEGFSYAWVNTDIRGQATKKVEEMTRKLWTIVPADRSPYKNFDPLDRNPLSSKGITYKDVILMERPERYKKMETDRLNHKTKTQLSSLTGVNNDHSGVMQSRPINSF
jgi:hypothetical protein